MVGAAGHHPFVEGSGHADEFLVRELVEAEAARSRPIPEFLTPLTVGPGALLMVVLTPTMPPQGGSRRSRLRPRRG